MRLSSIASLVLALIAVVIGLLGYAVGFRHGMHTGIRTESVARGVLAIHTTRFIEQQRLDNIRLLLESDIDNGIMQWGALERSQTFRFIDKLYGFPVRGTLEDYIRRLAAYRRDHASMYGDPELAERTVQNIAKRDPAFAAEIAKSQASMSVEMRAIVDRYSKPSTGSNNKLQRTHDGSSGEQ